MSIFAIHICHALNVFHSYTLRFVVRNRMCTSPLVRRSVGGLRYTRGTQVRGLKIRGEFVIYPFRSCPTLPRPGSSCCLVPALHLPCSYSATALLLLCYCPAPTLLLPCSCRSSAPTLLLPSSCPCLPLVPALLLLLLMLLPLPSCSAPAYLLLPYSCPVPTSALLLPCPASALPGPALGPALLQLLPTPVWQPSSSSALYDFFRHGKSRLLWQGKQITGYGRTDGRTARRTLPYLA